MLVSLALCTALASFAPTKAAKPRPVRKTASAKTAPVAITPLTLEVLERIGEPVVLRRAERAKLRQVVAALKEAGLDAPSKAPEAWAEAVSVWATRTNSTDVMALVQWVIREAYLESNEDLKNAAAKVAYYNTMKKRVRDQVSHYRKTLAGKPKSARVSMPLLTIRTKYQAGRKAVTVTARATKKVEEWQTLTKEWEDTLASVGDDAQLANLDLQNALQKQQQLLQMLSNISKILHDTATGIIDNMR